MNKYIISFLLLFCVLTLFAQTKPVESKILSRGEVNSLLTDSVRQILKIRFPVFRVYTCSDKSGDYFIALTESQDTIGDSGDTLSTSIRAVAFSRSAENVTFRWEFEDSLIRTSELVSGESAIWFWTRYSSFTDTDHDNLIDPVIVYGTNGMNGRDDGRVRLKVIYKEQPFMILNMNGVLDRDRVLQVDTAYYDLPAVLQQHVLRLMQKLQEDNQTIFPYGWQTAMKNRNTRIVE